jgi:hypothetical protein
MGGFLNLNSVNVYALEDSITQHEGNDFATQVLGDPWDMNEFSDIGTYLNNSNQTQYLTNVSVANGVFSASSVSNDPQFTLLFPGYLGAMSIGKVGANYPIDSSKYQCLYLAMDVDSAKPDYFEVYWFADKYLNGGTWGTTNVLVRQDLGWNLYSVNLANRNITFGGNTRWSDYTSWQGLRIDPSVNSASFSMDWARLTDCQSVDFELSNLPSNTSLTLYLAHNNREIRVSQPVQTSTGSVTFDLQGIEPGTYTYLVRNSNGNTVSSGNVTINQSPIAQFVNPSGWSGQDYSETLSAPWDMETPQSVSDVKCSDSEFSDGLLNIETNSVESLPSSCVSGGYADPKIYLTSLSQVNSAQYRYLNFKMNADGDLEDVPNGMIVRFIWTIKGVKTGTQCSMVSEDIPFGVGTNTYSIDLYDAYNGQIVEKSGSCSSSTTNWLNSGTVISFRFDPNENQMGRELNQKIDWIRLTKETSIQIGKRFGISMNLNKSADSIQSWNFYYTTTPSQPRQHPASVSLSSTGQTSIQQPNANYFSYLPMITLPTGFSYQDDIGDVSLSWDTSGTSAGEYYLCAELNDGLNSNIFCSSVPVILY